MSEALLIVGAEHKLGSIWALYFRPEVFLFFGGGGGFMIVIRSLGQKYKVVYI